jgi:hypothetical protein
MKVCPNCQQQYVDDDLNFCLSDGGMLVSAADEPPPTVMMNPVRTTDPNWTNETSFPPPWQQNQPLQQQQNQPYIAPSYMRGQDQTLPTIGMVLGILSILLICCYGGFYFGLPALILGFIGIGNVNKNPELYGGKGLAIAGMIMGGISLVFALIAILFAIAGRIH